MPKYEIYFDAKVFVTVYSDCEDNAIREAKSIVMDCAEVDSIDEFDYAVEVEDE